MDKILRFVTANRKLLLALGGMLLFSGYLYYSSRPTPQALTDEAHSLLSELEEQVGVEILQHDAIVNYLVAELATWEAVSFWQRLKQHLALAILITVILVVTVEWHTRAEIRREVQAYREQVGRDVWSAISGRLVQEPISREIDRILKQDVVRDECAYTLTLMCYDGMPEDLIVIRRELTYKLHNLTHQEDYSSAVRSYIQSAVGDIQCTDPEGNSIIAPGHRKLYVRGQQISMDKCLSKEDKRKLEYQVELPKEYRDFVEVYMDSDEVVDLTGGNTYVFMRPTIDLEVTVRNEIPDRVSVTTLIMHHPRSQEFRRRPDGVWEFKGGILPGQGFAIQWQEVKKGKQSEATSRPT